MSPRSGKQGKVYLVGAGPGDPKLLTLKGKECLEQADVVLYDYLANPALLQHAPRAQHLYVGRRGRGHYPAQEDITSLLIEHARAGKTVVRLKGGDPFVFGRGGEEAEAVAAAGLDFEVVPGVTAAVAVPAYAGIPVTHRTLASTVAFVTGHEDPNKPTSMLEWPKLATAHGTLVFLMGMKNLPAIVDTLMAEGRSRDTPVAVIRWGTRPQQKTVVGTLADIAARAEAAHMEPPTVIVVGDVVRMRAQLNWFEKRPLFGKRILVTRAREQARELSDLLGAYGAETIEAPAIELVPPDTWEPLDRAIGSLSSYRWLIFTSANGVGPFMDRLRAVGKDVRALSGLSIGCIGPRTAKELGKYGLAADLVPSEYQAEGLIAALGSTGIKGARVLIPRAEVAREILPDELKRLGAKVDVIPVYRTVAPSLDLEPLRGRLRAREIHAVTFTSSSTVRNFVGQVGGAEEAKALTRHLAVACIGPITGGTAEEYGLSVTILPTENTVPALAHAIARHFGEPVRVETAPTA